mgnify:CR=1 FL=1
MVGGNHGKVGKKGHVIAPWCWAAVVGAVVGIGGDGVVVVVLEDIGCVALLALAVPLPNLKELFLRLTLVWHSAVHLVPVELVPPI